MNRRSLPPISTALAILLVLSLLFLGLLTLPTGLAPQEGPNYAGASGTGDWVNPDRAVGAEESLCARSTYGFGIRSQFWNTFGFSIPSGDVIDGILVEVKWSWDNDPPNAGDEGLTLGKDESTLSVEKTWGTRQPNSQNPCNSGQEIDSQGGSTDLWGLSWTPAELNSASFTVRVRKGLNNQETDIWVNWIRVTVFHHTPESSFKDGSAVSIPSGAPALIDSHATTLPDATNLVLVFVQIDNTAAATRRIDPGNLEVRRGTLVTDPLIAENQFRMDMASDGNEPDGIFAFLIGRDTSPGANPTYGLFAGGSGAGLSAEAKFLILNGVAYSDSVDGTSVSIGGTETTLATLATTFPDQPSVVVAALQIDDSTDQPDISAGDLRLKRGVTPLASNQFLFEGVAPNAPGDGAFVLLVARDATPGASPTYNVTAQGTGPIVGADGEAKILAFSGLSSSSVDTGAVTVGTSRTVIGSTATTFPAGDDVLIGAFQYDATSASAQTWAAGSIDVARATNLDRASNEFPARAPANGQPENYFVGLLNAVTTASANPTYEGAAQAPAASAFDMELKLVAVHVQNAGVPSCDALTVVTSDPAGQLWFNETVEPDGIPFTTQLDVNATFQGATPALSVTNDGTATCDITIRLMSDPGTGRSLKFNTTNSAPSPADASKEVPLNPSFVTVCASVAPTGTCEIWLWADYESALASQSVVDVRVASM